MNDGEFISYITFTLTCYFESGFSRITAAVCNNTAGVNWFCMLHVAELLVVLVGESSLFLSFLSISEQIAKLGNTLQ